jgi:hypothetical protein
VSTDQLILEMLTKLDKRVEQLSERMDTKFNSLGCVNHALKLDRIEQTLMSQKERKASWYAAALAVVGACALSVWNWISRGSQS